MAYRGRGRGGFGGGGGFGYATQVPFELFPDVDLPNVKGILDPDKKINQERQNTEVERYSDRLKPKTTIRRGALFDILELKGFPQELTGGSRAQQPGRKRVRWNPDSELQKLDLFEKLEQRQGNNDGKEKKEGEGEDEDEEEEEEEPEEDFSDDDYQKNQDFDDDDDDFNMEDDGDDEPLL
ncbi:glutamic acid-rich protein-like isoform X2 [Prunus dulcis]|uniref:glutamic acid-rich protein-like isoform X2 n=1 Tax=Prunus dulcis TaxID=3755 RepID=UPI0014825D58|nr:glutamic acid-rich protein-like isoform X2 [Prunus dulcis]